MTTKENHQRRSIRLRGYDYSRAGAYFITICVQHRKCMLGAIADGRMELTAAGDAAAQCWRAIPDHFPHAQLDAFVVMPNHIHGIVAIVRDGMGAGRAPEQFGRPVAGSIPTIIRSFKSAATRRVNGLRQTPGAKLWQRNYWEHIVRNESELDRIRAYIRDNPVRWEIDRLHPKGISAHSGIRESTPPYGDASWMV